MRLVHWLVTLIVAFLVVIFAVSNRQPVDVTFWPLPIAVETRLFLVVLLATAVGFIAGQFVAWLGGRRWRQDARFKTRRIEALERELVATQARLTPSEGAGRSSSDLPPRSSGALAPRSPGT